MSTSAISLNKLSKRYAGTTTLSLDIVTLSIEPGEVYGFLGANGAGKSTTIRCLLNFIQPTSGSGTISGMDIVKDSVAIKRSVGYLAGDVALYNRMTGQEFIAYMAELQPPKHPALATTLTRDFRAELSKPIGQLSKGNRQKIGIIQAFMHEPDVIILDEPTSGLDPLMQEAFYNLVHTAKARGATVFFSSHNLNEVRRVCDRIGFIRNGQLVSEQRLDELSATAAHTFEVTFKQPAPLDTLRRLKGTTITISPDPHHVSVRIQGELSPFFGILARHDVSQIDQRGVDLEEEFMQLYNTPAKADAVVPVQEQLS